MSPIDRGFRPSQRFLQASYFLGPLAPQQEAADQLSMRVFVGEVAGEMGDKIETEATVRRRNLPFTGKTRSISTTSTLGKVVGQTQVFFVNCLRFCW